MKQGVTNTDQANVLKIIREYYVQLYTHTLDNLNKTNQFLEKHKLLQYTRNEMDNLNSPITIKAISFVNWNFPQRNLYAQIVALGEFHLQFEKNCIFQLIS